eukprot:c21781_g1_i1.p1 GENE.c21781_g1_i1~~c21781_g1_i1.p1  ORF type:complete len:915 (-),score=354.56 c21781_g1_i1:42-2786(-)
MDTFPKFPEELIPYIQKDVCFWLKQSIKNTNVTQQLDPEQILEQLHDGKVFWELVLSLTPDFEPQKNKTNEDNKFEDFREWCSRILLLDETSVLRASDLKGTTGEEQVFALSEILEIEKQLHILKQFEVTPSDFIRLELKIDNALDSKKDNHINGVDNSSSSYVPASDDELDSRVSECVTTYCPSISLRRISVGLYSAQYVGYFYVQQLDSDYYVRYDSLWYSIQHFFSTIVPQFLKSRSGGVQSVMGLSKAKDKRSNLSSPKKNGQLSPKTRMQKISALPKSMSEGTMRTLIPKDLLDSSIFKGEWMTKAEDKGKLEKFFVRISGVTADTLMLTWTEGQTAAILNNYLGRHSIKLSDVTEVRLGQRTTKFGRIEYTLESDLKSFSIIYLKPNADKPNTLDFICNTNLEREMWVRDLRNAVNIATQHQRIMYHSKLEEKWFQLFPNVTTITKSQLKKLFRTLHIKVTNKDLVGLMNYYDANQNQRWEFAEFEQMVVDFETNIRPEISQVISRYTGGKKYFTSLEFQNFEKKCQHEDLDWGKLNNIFNEFESPLQDFAPTQGILSARSKSRTTRIKAEKLKGNLSVRENKALGEKMPIASLSTLAFVRFLKADENQLFEHNTEVDLNAPLTDYFISSSHNTYLNGAQYLGESSVDAYIQALRRGARCLELDLHDGPTPQQPVVIKHGGAGTTVISFEAVCRAINEFAFERYKTPVILSLETHLSKENQRYAARFFQEIFGERLLLPDPDAATQMVRLPSPKNLIEKIILKGKGDRPAHGGAYVEDDDTNEQINHHRPVFVTLAVLLFPFLGKLLQMKTKNNKKKEQMNQEENETIPEPEKMDDSIVPDPRTKSLQRRHSFRKNMDPEFVSVLYFKQYKTKPETKALGPAMEKGYIWNMTSFPDTAIDHLSNDPSV